MNRAAARSAVVPIRRHERSPITGPVAGDAFARIDEGTYIGICISGEIQRARSYGRYVAHVRFALPAEGVDVPFFCNLGDHDNLVRGRSRKGPASKFYKAWAVGAGRVPRAGEEMSLTVFIGKTFRVKVRTVSTDADQDPLPEALRYSVIDKLLELVDV